MKQLVGLALFGVLGWYLWKNWFSQLNKNNDPSVLAVEEVELKNEIGDAKRSVQLANEVPFATYGDSPYAGTPLTIFTAPILKSAKPLTYLPKGSSQNPYDRIAWTEDEYQA
jgi:hypothetical protein